MIEPSRRALLPALALCVILALTGAVVGVWLFSFTVAETIQQIAMTVAAFYFGRWVKRNLG